MQKNKIIITAITVVAILGFLTAVYLFTNKSSETTQSTTVNPEVNKIKPDDHIKWATDKKNVLVEYGDFQCPACKSMYSLIKPLEASGSADFEITKKITLVFRHFPLFQAHPNAYAAAYAAEAADKQDKFFEYHDALYDSQKDWSDLRDPKDFFVNLAKELELDTEKFRKDIDDKTVKDRVEADLTSGNVAGVNSTPSFFLNGRKLEISSFDDFKKFLKEVK